MVHGLGWGLGKKYFRWRWFMEFQQLTRPSHGWRKNVIRHYCMESPEWVGKFWNKDVISLMGIWELGRQQNCRRRRIMEVKRSILSGHGWSKNLVRVQGMEWIWDLGKKATMFRMETWELEDKKLLQKPKPWVEQKSRTHPLYGVRWGLRRKQ